MNETIKWIATVDDMPDDSISVLIIGREHPDEINTMVWLGYWDSADSCWRTSDGNQVDDITHWAEMPIGPTVQP